MQRAWWVLVVLGCGSSSSDSVDALSLGENVFDDNFETGGWGGFPGQTNMAIGNPAPSMQFPNGTTMLAEKLLSVTFANQSMVATAEVMPIFIADSGTIYVRFIAAIGPMAQPTQVMNFAVTKTMGTIQATMNDVPLAHVDGFRTLRIRMSASGTTLEVDGEVFPWLTTPAALTTNMVHLSIGSNADGARGSFYVDNVRVYRGP